MFSIVIPSWNNLRYLRLCVESLRRHSARPHQILVHVNDGSDGTRDWVAREGLEHTATETNVGICVAVNLAAARARADCLLYLNDDMVAAPGWDVALERALGRVAGFPAFMLSGTMVEPVATGNPCVVVADHGRDPDHFDLDRFAREAPARARSDWLGATWPPTLVPREVWHRVGGYSIEFSPGMGSDNDFSMKLWHEGCRVFLGVGDSLFYHFAKASTSRIRKNDGRRQFLMKWDMTQSAFDRHCLRRGAPVPGGGHGFVLAEPARSWDWRLERIKAALRRRFL
jgi:glycosyltransferase involved in cell wall biosynthesis